MARAKRQQKSKGSSGFNRKNSEDFLQKNSLKQGVVTTETGLQYLVIEEGAGDAPGEADVVEVQQRISLVDGTVISDTYKKSETAKFSLQEAIEGYREGLLMMSAGSRYRFFIHPDLAWGKRGAGKRIGPNAALIIDARLLEVL